MVPPGQLCVSVGTSACCSCHRPPPPDRFRSLFGPFLSPSFFSSSLLSHVPFFVSLFVSSVFLVFFFATHRCFCFASLRLPFYFFRLLLKVFFFLLGVLSGGVCRFVVSLSVRVCNLRRCALYFACFLS